MVLIVADIYHLQLTTFDVSGLTSLVANQQRTFPTRCFLPCVLTAGPYLRRTRPAQLVHSVMHLPLFSPSWLGYHLPSSISSTREKLQVVDEQLQPQPAAWRRELLFVVSLLLHHLGDALIWWLSQIGCVVGLR